MNTLKSANEAITLAIDGMSCGHCVQAVAKTLSAVAGVKILSVAVGLAIVETTDEATASKAMMALDDAGYPAKMRGVAASETSQNPAKAGGCCGGSSSQSPGSVSSAKASGGCCG